MCVCVCVCVCDTETKDNLLTAGQNGLNIMRILFYSFKSKIIHWLSYFICDNKYTFVQQMPPDLAMLLVFLFETVDLVKTICHIY